MTIGRAMGSLVVLGWLWSGPSMAATSEEELAAEALKIQAHYFTHCGDDWYAQFPSQSVGGGYVQVTEKHYQRRPAQQSAVFRQYKDLTMAVRLEDLSYADQLNGIAWRGVVSFHASVQREFNALAGTGPFHNDPQGWSAWRQAGSLFIGTSLEKKGGQIQERFPLAHFFIPRAPDCTTIPQ